MTVINTNIKSLVSQNALTRNSRALASAMEQLSTGKRINSAKDDAAGLAISSRMTAQIRGLDQAIRNANDGISLLQTAEGATIEMTNMLQRMRELAVQSANDTNTTSDREYLDLEYQQLSNEINRIANSTEWNGMNILNNSEVGTSATSSGGTAREVKFQVGANTDQTISVFLKDFSTGTAATPGKDQLNLAAQNLSTATTLTFDIVRGSTTSSFTVPITSPASPATAANATALATQLRTAINNTVGFERVQVSAVGTTISIEDSVGGNLSNFAAKNSSNASVTSTNVLIQTQTGTAANTNADPAVANPAAVFGGSARINNTDIKFLTTANTALLRLDVAIDNINKERANLGAYMNRLTYAGDNLTNVSQNTSASRSRILDADYAKASSELSRTQIIQQAATAVLAQANTDQQSVLKLLQG